MFHKLAHNSLSAACLLQLLALILFASSCGHAQTSPPLDLTDPVTKAILDYGRGHSGLLAPGTSERSDEKADDYLARIGKILAQEDFAQLEKIAQQNRIEKGRLLGGPWELVGFYDVMAIPVYVGELKDSDYAHRIATLNKWIVAFPESAAARISLALVYVNWAGLARGGGFADSVSDYQWAQFRERTVQARAILLEASSLKEKDPFWYFVMQQVAHNQGWDKAHARDLLDQAVAFEPDFFHYYREYADYLLPQWYGEPGDIPAFAEEATSKIPEPDASILYFQIVSSVTCYCKDESRELMKTDYPKLKRGYFNLTRLYGVSSRNANRFAFMAGSFGDRTAAHDAIAQMTTTDLDIWYTQDTFNTYRNWANGIAPRSPQ